MNRDDILQMARESGTKDKMGALQISRIELEAFAIFIEEAEREACARVCDELDRRWVNQAEKCAELIRARSK